MEFLKALFKNGEALTYEQLAAAVTEAKLNVVNIADGSYVSRSKFNDKVNALNGQITDLTAQVSQRDTDLADVQQKLTAAQADGTKLVEAQQALTTLQGKYDADKQAYAQKLAAQQYEFAVKEQAGRLEFSSASARKTFIRDAIEKQFKMEGETLVGFTDFLEKYKTDDPGAFKATAPAEPPALDKEPPTIVLPGTPSPAPAGSGFNFHFGGVRPKPKTE